MAGHFETPTDISWHGGDLYVTCAGTVRAPHGAAISRLIVAYLDGDPFTVINYGVSLASDGSFSFQLPGWGESEFTVIAKGLYGENDSVESNCNLNGTGPTGLYIPQPLNNIQFYVGPGAVNSPFVDILIPSPIVDAEGQVDIITWGDNSIPVPVVDAEGITPIIAWGDVNFGFAQVEGVADVYYETDASPQIPMWQVSAEASTSIYAWGDVKLPLPKVNGVQATFGTVNLPSWQVEAEASNPIVCHGDVRIPSAVVSSQGESGRVSWGSPSFPVPAVSGLAVVDDVHTGAATITSWTVAGVAHVEEVSTGQVSFPAAQVYGVAEQTHVFAPLDFDEPCDIIFAHGAVEVPMWQAEAA